METDHSVNVLKRELADLGAEAGCWEAETTVSRDLFYNNRQQRRGALIVGPSAPGWGELFQNDLRQSNAADTGVPASPMLAENHQLVIRSGQPSMMTGGGLCFVEPQLQGRQSALPLAATMSAAAAVGSHGCDGEWNIPVSWRPDQQQQLQVEEEEQQTCLVKRMGEDNNRTEGGERRMMQGEVYGRVSVIQGKHIDIVL